MHMDRNPAIFPRGTAGAHMRSVAHDGFEGFARYANSKTDGVNRKKLGVDGEAQKWNP